MIAPPPTRLAPCPAPAPFCGRDRQAVPRRGWGTLEEAATTSGTDIGTVLAALARRGWCDGSGRPVALARREEHARWMEAARGWRWRLEDVARAVAEETRGQRLPQDAPRQGGKTAEPCTSAYRGIRAIGRQRGMSAIQVGRVLRRTGWRNADGMPTAAALGCGMAQVRPSLQGRVRVHWHAGQVLDAIDACVRREQQVRQRAETARRLHLGRPARVGKKSQPHTPPGAC